MEKLNFVTLIGEIVKYINGCEVIDDNCAEIIRSMFTTIMFWKGLDADTFISDTILWRIYDAIGGDNCTVFCGFGDFSNYMCKYVC